MPNGNKLAGNHHSSRSGSTSPPLTNDIATFRKHAMDYFTEDGVILRTGFTNKRDWFLLCIRELIDNCVDFLVKNYKGSENTVITTEISKNDKYFQLKVRNSNSSSIEVFEDKAAIFDNDQRYGSKQDLHIISRGMLGDAMKQILAFGYILTHIEDNGSSFEDKQWERPLIIRHNNSEYKIYLKVDKTQQTGISHIQKSPNELEDSNTEIELMLPIPREVKTELTRTCIEEFCKKYPLFTTDVTFKFEITEMTSVNKEKKLAESLLNNMESKSPRETIKIEYEALHPISTESWNKQNSVHSYTPEEFKRRIFNIDRKQAADIKIYDLLQTYREASNLKKTHEHKTSVADLLALPDQKQNQKVATFYKQLETALPPLEKLVLPYTTNKGERKDMLIARLRRLYNNLDADNRKASYKGIHARYEDGNISFPFYFEILAIPFDDPRSAENNVVFIGAVNYSISPKENSNLFEGDYSDYIDDVDPYSKTKDILGVLHAYGFHNYANDTAKIPCLIIANLVTPKRSPNGQDKSRIDITPFAGTIVQAVKRIASDIKSYRAMRIHFSNPKERRGADYIPSGRGKLEGLLTNYLSKNHGLHE